MKYSILPALQLACTGRVCGCIGSPYDGGAYFSAIPDQPSGYTISSKLHSHSVIKEGGLDY